MGLCILILLAFVICAILNRDAFKTTEKNTIRSLLRNSVERKKHLLPKCPKWQHDVMFTDISEQWRDSIKEYVGLNNFDENIDLETLSDDDSQKFKEYKAIVEYFEKNGLMRSFLISELSKIKECEMGYRPYDFWHGELYDEEYENMYLEYVKLDDYFSQTTYENDLTFIESKLKSDNYEEYNSLVAHGIKFVKFCANNTFENTKEKIRIYKETGKYYK